MNLNNYFEVLCTHQKLYKFALILFLSKKKFISWRTFADNGVNCDEIISLICFGLVFCNYANDRTTTAK